MKKIITFLFAIIAITACTEKEVAVTSVSVSPATLELTAGDAAVSLSAKVLPDNAIASVSWTSSDNSVASVSSNGAVSPLKEGSAIITATAGGKSGTCKVTVKAKTTAVTAVSLDKSEITLTEGENATLKATITPDNATNKNVNWKSSDAAVASVDNSGKVTAVKAGEATITVTTEDGNKTATCKVTVKAKTTAVTAVSLDKSEITLTEGENTTLKATIAPDNATNKNVSWKSSDASIASVDNAGKVTAVKAGEATITVTTEDGNKTATCKVTVNKSDYVAVTGVSLSASESIMYIGEGTWTFGVTIIPENATDKAVTWSSSDESVASVNQIGGVTPLKAGETIITVTTRDGGKTATLKVTVGMHVESVSLDKGETTLTEEETATLKAIIAPDNAANKNVSWKSSDAAIASVDNSGKVTAIKAGEATIIVTTEDGNKTATCRVTVKEKVYPVESVSLDKSELTLFVGEKYTLNATITPSNATNKNISWKSSNTSIATVDNKGQVTALKEGEATITVTTEDGGKTATCRVTIEKGTYAYVDLGLSVKWATCNVGAKSETDYGSYFAWGETAEKADYSIDTYKWGKQDETASPDYGMTKYNTKDKLKILEAGDDPATVNWGSKWRTPTNDEIKELHKNCVWTWITKKDTDGADVKGYTVTSKINGNSIFLPAAGHRYGTELWSAGKDGYYWSSSLYAPYPLKAHHSLFNSSKHVYGEWNRFIGLTVRAVTE